jgi:hypothetical protein
MLMRDAGRSTVPMTRALRLASLCLPLLAGCASGGPVPESADPVGRAPAGAPALLEALRDTTSASHVYLPREVARAAESINDPRPGLEGATPAGVEPHVLLAGIRGVVDTLGRIERSTLTVLPGSDPREGSIMFQRATKAQWRPARLADGRAVRQLIEWQLCRAGGTTCAHYDQDPIERNVPRIQMP